MHCKYDENPNVDYMIFYVKLLVKSHLIELKSPIVVSSLIVHNTHSSESKLDP
jgi:hypothetical protein